MCLLDTLVNCAKTAEPIGVPFEAGTWGPRNHVLDGGPNLPRVRGSFGGILGVDILNKAMWPMAFSIVATF